MSTIKVNSIVPNSGTHVSGAFTGTFSGSIENERLDRLESFSSSLDAAFATDAQLTSLSASLDTRINAATNEQDLSGLATKVELNDFTASYSTDSASFADRLDNTGGGGSTDISALNSFTASAATTGSNVFTGSQYVSGGLFVQEYSNFGKSGIAKAADFLNAISVTGSVTTQANSIGGFIGNFYRQWDSFGSQGGDGGGSVGYFVGNQNDDRKLRLTSDADIQLNHGNGTGRKIQIPRTSLGESKLELSGSFALSSSIAQDWYVPQINLLTNQTGVLSMGTYSSTLGGYFNFDIYNFGSESEGTWIQNSQRIKLMTPNLQLSAGNGDPGIINVIGKLNVTGSMGISGSIIPALGSSSTSSFSLGSSTAAWKDIWVSQGTIHFLDGAGVSQGTLSTTANGIQSDGDIYVNSNVRVGKGPGINGLNTVFGMGALQSNTSGSSNTAIGGSALSSNTTGQLNTAIGGSTLAFNTTGYYNTAVGQGALYTNNGIANTAVGVRAGNGSTEANNSTVMGYEALRNVTTGDGNMAIGYQAGYFASGSSTQNLYLGYQAGPTASIEENFKLYIDFQQNEKPLIGGDFQQREVTVNGMLNVTTFLTLPPQNPLPVNPSPTLGSMAVSGSALYFYNGAAWKEVSLVP
jgi:hypothetical protein